MKRELTHLAIGALWLITCALLGWRLGGIAWGV